MEERPRPKKRKRKGKKKKNRTYASESSKKRHVEEEGTCNSAKAQALTILDIADELLVHVFSYLDVLDLTTCSVVCHQWKRISQDDSLWKMMFNHYWGLRVKNWKQLVACQYEQFEEKDIEQLTKELANWDRGGQGAFRKAVFFLYRFNPSGFEEEAAQELETFDEEEENEDDSPTWLPDIAKQKAKERREKMDPRRWRRFYREMWEAKDIFLVDEESLKEIIAMEITSTADGYCDSAWIDWMESFGGRPSDWKEKHTYTTIYNVIRKRLMFNGYDGDVREIGIGYEQAESLANWLLMYFPEGKARLFVTAFQRVSEDDLYVQGFALISQSRFCTFWSEVVSPNSYC